MHRNIYQKQAIIVSLVPKSIYINSAAMKHPEKKRKTKIRLLSKC